MSVFADKYLKGITDLAQNKLGESQLLDTMTTEHFWKTVVSVAAELVMTWAIIAVAVLLFPKSAYSVPSSAMSHGIRWALMVCIVACVLKISIFKGVSNGYVGRRRRHRPWWLLELITLHHEN